MNITDPRDLPAGYIREAMASVADTCIIPLQDYLELGNEARMNLPSTIGQNWKWRMKDKDLTAKLAKRMKELVTVYGRGKQVAPR